MDERERLLLRLDELHGELAKAATRSQRATVQARIDDLREELRVIDGAVHQTTGRGWA